MTSKLGLHWIREHPDNNRDLAHVEAMQYRSVKLFKPAWDNRDFCRDLLTVLPTDAYILARDHDLSEQKEDMWRDAQAAGINHANQWIDKVRRGLYHMPLDRTFFLGVNEPDATHGDRNKIDIYTESFLRHLQANGLRGGAFNFSTGHPRTVDGTANTPADYTVFERSHRAIVDGHHIGVLHIYGTAAVPLAPGHYDRLRACTWTDVEWVVGECGADEHVIGGGAHDGYLRSMADNPTRYCPWLDDFIIGINDARIHSYQVFTHDFSHPWDSFDIRPISHALENYQWRHMTTPATKPPIDTRLPSVIAPGPSPVEPTPAGDDWPRIYAFIKRWEGGWAEDVNDPGGATNKGITIGTFKRWRVARGLPEPTKADLRNITDAEAEQIFYEWYYKESGADELAWPLSLAMTDTAVNAGVGRAQEMLQKSGGNFLAYMGHLVKWYTEIKNFEHFGRAWIRRRGDILLEASKA